MYKQRDCSMISAHLYLKYVFLHLSAVFFILPIFIMSIVFFQHHLRLPTRGFGVRMITKDVIDAMPELPQVSVGLLHLFLRHTSASLSINENADPDVRVDLDMALDRIVPETFPYTHTLEGRDDMPAHVKSSLLGVSLTVPVGDGRLLLGTWQGIYLWEHRRCHQNRTLILSLQGETLP